MTLNIEADEYLAEFSESYGAIVDVTSSKEMHFPEENGYLVAPGQVTNIGFTRVSLALQVSLENFKWKEKYLRCYVTTSVICSK